jgi:hypothetical protein
VAALGDRKASRTPPKPRARISAATNSDTARRADGRVRPLSHTSFTTAANQQTRKVTPQMPVSDTS